MLQNSSTVYVNLYDISSFFLNSECTISNNMALLTEPIESTNYSLIIGSVVAVTLVVALVVIGTILWRRNRRYTPGFFLVLN